MKLDFYQKVEGLYKRKYSLCAISRILEVQMSEILDAVKSNQEKEALETYEINKIETEAMEKGWI